MVVIDGQIAITLPQEKAILGAHGLGLDKTHVDEDLDALLDDLLVDRVIRAVFLYLHKDCLCNGIFVTGEDDLVEQ